LQTFSRFFTGAFKNKALKRLGRVVNPNTPRRLRKAKRSGKKKKKKSKEVISEKKRKGKKKTGKAIYKKAFILKKARRAELSQKY
jgi:hypothetical protein